jgi:hypothetical protein
VAWSFSLNLAPATAGEAIWRLKEALVSAGWSVARSGTGTGGVYSAGGDAHAPGGPYAGTLDLANAWLELRQPVAATPRRSILMQLATVDTGRWRIWYSSNGTGFTGGAQTASVRGTATDEQGLTNTPAGLTEWIRSISTFNGPGVGIVDVVAGDASEGFSFFFGMRPIVDVPAQGFAGYETALYLDVLTGAQGTDADPAIIATEFAGASILFASHGSSSGALGEMNATQTSGCSRGWFKKGLAGAAFVVYPPCFLGCQEGFVGSVMPRAVDRASESADSETFTTLPVFYWRGGASHATQRGFKGKSRLFFDSQRRLGGLRLSKDRTRLSIGCVSIPWDGASIPTF